MPSTATAPPRRLRALGGLGGARSPPTGRLRALGGLGGARSPPTGRLRALGGLGGARSPPRWTNATKGHPGRLALRRHAHAAVDGRRDDLLGQRDRRRGPLPGSILLPEEAGVLERARL